MEEKEKEHLNFIEEIVEDDLRTGKYQGRVHTRFPPEPNGYLHIGHAKSICLNFGLANKYGGKTNLRFDDTNPVTEDVEYVDSIREDVKWLGFDWEEREFYASNYFEPIYEYAKQLIQKGKAYVDDSSSEEIAKLKGTPTEAGKDSPYRSRSAEENLDLFERMKAGEFEEGTRVLRAKIDMASPNMILRDPVIYRIKKVKHHRTGAEWNIYPMYDFAHCLSDSIEGITHSICTLEFEVHRPLYDWCLIELGIYRPQQIEFARLNLNYTIMSKRKLLLLVQNKHVNGWDDPRMPTISGMRRRGYPAAAIREFAKRVGVARRENIIEIGLLEYCVREELNRTAQRVMAVLDPVKLILTNYPENQTEDLQIENNPEDPNAGKRAVPFSRELWIEREDFMEIPPKKFFRLLPGGMVRLKGAYIIKCEDIVKDAEGTITEIHCTYIENSRSGNDQSEIHVKGTIHWVAASHAIRAEIRAYDRLFNDPDPASSDDFIQFMNPTSLQLTTAYLEPYLKAATLGNPYQFIRKGYYCLDSDSTPDKMVFNQTVGLKDPWANTAAKAQ